MIKHLMYITAGAAFAIGTAALAEKPTLAASPPGCIDATSSPEQKTEAGNRIVVELLGPRNAGPPLPAFQAATFGRDLQALSSQNVFANLWGRCGLSRRDRSLVTLGILIALRAEGELQVHFPIAIRNGLTRSELEEVVYHSSGYAGFPAAASARRVAEDSLGE